MVHEPVVMSRRESFEAFATLARGPPLGSLARHGARTDS